MKEVRKAAESSLESENKELKARVDALTKLVEALQQRKEPLAIENEALKLSIESAQMDHKALLKEIEPLKRLNEELKVRVEQLQRTIGDLQSSVEALQVKNEDLTQRFGAIKERDEAVKRRDDEIKLRNEQLRNSEDFAKFLRDKASEVKKIRVNGKAITSRLIRVFFEIADKGSAHVFQMTDKLHTPRSTMTRDLQILRAMKWVCLKGSYKFGAYVLTDEGRSVIEAWKGKM